MAIKKISEFTSGTPTSVDKILFEQSGAGKSATIGDVGKAIGINMDNLWTNESNTSAFASQTISLDLTKYRYVRIIFKRNISSEEVFFHDCFIGMNTICMLGVNANGYRSVTVTNSGISFGDYLEYTNYNGNNFETLNRFGIPFVILGVK